MPKFYKQNKKKIDPRYFLSETRDHDHSDEDTDDDGIPDEEELAMVDSDDVERSAHELPPPDRSGKMSPKMQRKFFFGPGGLREKATLDILSIWEMPSEQEVAGHLFQRQMTSWRPKQFEIDRHLFNGPDYQTTGTDYRPYSGREPHDASSRHSGRDNPVPDEEVGKYFHDKTAADVSFMDYMIKYLMDQGWIGGPVNLYADAEYHLTPAGARKYYEIKTANEKSMHPTRQGGVSTSFGYQTYDTDTWSDQQKGSKGMTPGWKEKWDKWSKQTLEEESQS